MRAHAAITVRGSRDEVERLWRSPEHHPSHADAAVRFAEAPGDRGTEIHVDLEHHLPGGKLGETLARLAAGYRRAKVKDDLRRFKAHVETGEVAR